MHEIEAARGYLERFARCFTYRRDPQYIEHSIRDMVAQRVIGVCLDYEDINEHDMLRRDTLLATVCDNKEPTRRARRHARDNAYTLAGKSILNQLETFGMGMPEN